MRLRDAVAAVRESGDFGPLQEAIPYNRFMGISAELVDGEVIGTMRYSEHLVGNANVPALHGGTQAVPKTINITVEYLRGAKPQDVFAKAVFTRHGRRVANVRVSAYQDDPDKPVAVATAHFLLVQD